MDSETNFNNRNVLVGQDGEWPMVKAKSNTRNAWRLYYYMLSRSAICWNGRMDMRPYYFVQNKEYYFSKGAAARDLGVDLRTINSSLARLEENGLMHTKRDAKGKVISWEFVTLELFYPLNVKIIRSFISLGKHIDWETMLRLFSMLAFSFHEGLNSFTLTDLVKGLRLNHTRSKDDDCSQNFVLLCLQWWKACGLINYTKEKKYMTKLKKYYIVYTLTNLVNDIPEKMMDDFEQSEAETEWQKLFGQAFSRAFTTSKIGNWIVNAETGEVLNTDELEGGST